MKVIKNNQRIYQLQNDLNLRTKAKLLKLRERVWVGLQGKAVVIACDLDKQLSMNEDPIK